MHINDAIRQQSQLVKLEAAKLDETIIHNDKAMMNTVWCVRTLMDTLAEMIVARDNGKNTW